MRVCTHFHLYPCIRIAENSFHSRDDMIFEITIKTYFCSILLYSKVDEPAVIEEAARAWLHCFSNRGAAGFGTVAELYLLHVLVPLGHTDQARDMITGEVGSHAFTDDQRQTALEVVEETEQHRKEPAANPDCDSNMKAAAHPVSHQGWKYSILIFTLCRLFPV